MDGKPSPSHSFGITTCGEMLAKLERELERLARGTGDPQAVVDHSVNFALTAYHMLDWIWQLHFRHNPDAQRRLANDEMNNASINPPQELQRIMFEKCAALRTCYDIARGAKHVFLEQKKPIVAGTGYISREPAPFVVGVSELGGGGDVLTEEDGSISFDEQHFPIIDMIDGRERAIQVFDGIALFWRQLFQDLGID